MTLPDQLTAAEFERLKAQEQRMLNSGSWVPQAENVYAARLNESAARESMPDTMSAEQADVAAAEQSVMAETPFGRSVGAEPDYSSTPAVNPADSEPKTIDELRRRQKEVYHDPSYDMPFDEWREYTNWDRENSGAVEGFLGGLSGAPQALGQLGFNLVKERGQQYRRVMSGDPIGALDTEVATFKEMGRKVGVGLTQFVDWVGGKVNDMVTSGRRVGQKQAQIVAALREDGKLTGDPMQDNDTIRMAMEEAAAQGMFDDSQNEQTEDEQAQYQRYLRQKQYDRDYAGISEYSLGGNRVTLPEVKQSFANPITGNVAQPQEATATAASMVFDPINAVPIGAGALSKVRMLRRLASVTGTPLKYAEQLGATADSWLMRQGDRITSKIPLVGDLPLGQRAAVLAGAAGVGAYVDSKTDGGLSLVTTPLMVAGGILPVMKASGTVLRKTGAVGGAGWQIVKEMDAGGIGAARAATAERMASSGAFGQFSQYMRPGASGVESSLRRVSMNPDAPETLRRVARSADNIGITQVARAADDLVSSSLVAGATAVPFALVAPDEQTAGQIVGGAMTLGGALGTAGRFLGRRSARADADISRMLVDVEMAGGDAKSLLSLDYASLDWLAAQQGLTQGKVDVIPLRAQEYRANVDIKNSGAETVAGLHLDRTTDGRAKIYVNMGHTAPIAGRVSVKDVQITRNGKTEKASVVRIKGEDGRSDFTVVPKEYPLLVKSGDVVGENTHLARGLSPRRIMPHEIGHAILTSNILDGAIRDDMRNLVNQQYGTDGIEARGREYVTRLVDRDIMAGAHDALPDKLTQQEFDNIAAGKATMADVVKGKPMNDAERTRLINERMEEMRDQSRSAGNNPDGLDVFRDEVVAETFSSLSESIDFRKMRTGGPRVMESIYNGMTRMFETLGLNFDQSTGKLLDNPSVIFRDNPLTKDPVMRKRLQEHVRNYEALMVNMEQAGQRKQRGTPVSSDGTAESARRSTHTKLRPNDNGILENDIIFIDQNGNAQWKPQNMLDEQERGRASQVMFLYEKDKILPANSKEFGRRRAADGRILISGPTLPAKFDALRWFPRWLRPNKSTGDIGLARTLEASRDEGMSYIFDVNVIGSGESGRYRVKNRGDIRAVIREGAFIGWQATKNHHLNAVVLDLNAFRSSAMKAINDGKLGVFNNDMTQLQADLMQYMSNHKNGLPGEAGIGIEKRDLLNGLIGTGTAVQRAANPLYSDLNPRGSIRTFRVDRLNDAQPTGRTGYHIDYDKINNNRMPSALPQSGMAMPDGPARGERADIPLNPRARQAAFISDRGEVRSTGRATHFETNEDLGPDFLAIGAGHLGEDGFFRFGSQTMDDAMGDSPATSAAAAARYNQSVYDQGKRPSAMLEEPPGLERPAMRGQAMADVGSAADGAPRRTTVDVAGQQTMVQRNPAGEYEPLGMLKKQKNGNWAVYTAPMMATNKDGTQTMLPPSKLAEYPNEAKARARAEKEFFTSLPLQDAKQYLGPREQKAITEAQRRIAEVAKDNPEAARLEVTRDDRGLPKVGLIEDADGNPVLDERGNQKFGAIYRKAKYGLREAPGLSKDEARAVQQAADLMEADARRGQANPAIAKGIGWYGRMRGWLQQAYGATIEMFGQLLGATSARTPVDTNFIQAREALQLFGRGAYDDLLQRFDAFVMQKKADADSGKMEADWRKKGGKGTFKLQDEYRKQVNSFKEVPLRANGKKYNANSTKVLHALYGNWIAQTKGPKTPNFAGNLTGRTFKATIDVWAARNLRRLLYQGKAKRWRILPEQEQGVADVDFFFGQKVYDEVGRRMGIPTDDLQALQWFNEKDIWETNDWTDKTGAEKSSFDKEAGKLNLDRYQVGLTTFQDAGNFDPAVQRAELAAFRDSIRAQEGLEAARVTESEGLYGNVVEPTFDAEFSVNRKGEVSPSIEPIIRQAIDTANRNKQNDVFISAVVEETHPNARPMVEVGFKSAASRAEIDAVTAVFRGAGIDGFTVARNERGDVLGIRAQYVPEISARYDTLDHLDPAQFAVRADKWMDMARNAIASLENQDNVSYRKEGHVSTNVYGIEEYGSVTPADILRSSSSQELGRRRAILEAGAR